MADEVKTIRIVIDSSRAVDGSASATSALRRLAEQAAAAGSTLDKIQASIARVGDFLKVFLIDKAAEVVARLVEMGKAAFEAAAGMGELAEQIGLTAAELQGLQFIGVQSGASIDDVTTAATKFSVKMGEAANGSKEVIDGLKQLGVQNLDLSGKLRPTADLMAEVAAKITAIEDPAKRSAAQVEFFGKSGTKMAAVMADMSKGLNAATQDAQKFGAMISDETIKKLDALDDQFSRSALKHRAFFAELLADATDYGDKLNKFLSDNAAALGKNMGTIPSDDGADSGWTARLDSLRDKLDAAGVMIARFNAQVVEAFRGLPDLIGKAIIDGLNAVLRNLAAGLNLINSTILDSMAWLGIGKGANAGNAVTAPQFNGGGASFGDYSSKIGAAGDAAASKLREQQQAEYDARQQQRGFQAQADMQSADAAARVGSRNLAMNPNTGLNSQGGGYSAPKDDGSAAKAAEAQAEKLQKLKDSLNAAAVAQDAMTAAARNGDVAFQQQQAAAEATAKAIDFFGGKVAATDPKVKALADTLQKPIFDKMQGAAAQSFVVATTELTKQNELLTAQIALMNEAPEVQARELAIIKSKQEATKAGIKDGSEDLENRRKAIEQNETLKIQAEQLKQANELWTEPLKEALRNIQTAGADAFETMLNTGNITFQSLGETFSKIIKRMIAEFLALATIRPVMSLFVEAIGPGGAGLIGGQTAASLGFPSGGTSGGSIGGMPGSGLFGSLLGSGSGTTGGWLGQQISGIKDFMSSPLYGFNGPINTSSPAASAAMNGSSGAGFGGIFSGSGPTGAQALGGAFSIGAGALGLLKGGQSTAGTIGSIGQMVGGAITMLPIPGAQIVGPVVSLLSSIIPGLFGGGPQIPPQPALAYGAGQFRPTAAGTYAYGGDSLGSGTALTSGAQTLGTSLQAAFRAAGLTVVPSALIGGNLASGVDHTLQDGKWSDRPYTNTGLILPGGGYESLTDNDASRNGDQASEYLLAQAFKANVLRGGVSGAGEGLKTGLETINPITSADLDRVVSLGTAYDKLGKAINPAKDAIDKISASFDDLKSFATEAGLSLDPINAELKKQSVRSAQDFIDGMLDPLAVQMRALDDAKEQALTSAQYIKDNVEGVNVDINKIVDYYGKQRVALEDQYYGNAITNLKALIASATYGALANASPTVQLAGAQSAYNDALTGARSGDQTSIANFAGTAQDYLTASNSYYAGGPEYEAIRKQIVAASIEIQANLTNGTVPDQQAANATIAQTQATLQQQAKQFDDLMAAVAELTKSTIEVRDQQQRLLSA